MSLIQSLGVRICSTRQLKGEIPKAKDLAPCPRSGRHTTFAIITVMIRLLHRRSSNFSQPTTIPVFL